MPRALKAVWTEEATQDLLNWHPPKFTISDFENEAVVLTHVTTFAGDTYEVIVAGSDINNGNPAKFKRICSEQLQVGWKNVAELRFQDFSGNHVCYVRKRKNQNFTRTEWDDD